METQKVAKKDGDPLLKKWGSVCFPVQIFRQREKNLSFLFYFVNFFRQFAKKEKKHGKKRSIESVL